MVIIIIIKSKTGNKQDNNNHHHHHSTSANDRERTNALSMGIIQIFMFITIAWSAV